MQTVSAGFTTASTAQSRAVTTRVYVQWDGTTWTEETSVSGASMVVSWDFTRAIGAPGETRLTPPGKINIGTIVLDNSTRRYSANHTAGDASIRSYISGRKGMMGIAVRIDAGFYVSGSAEYVRVFNGYIYHGAPTGDSLFTLQIRGLGFDLLQNRVSTSVQKDLSVDEWINYLAVTKGGLSSNDVDLDATPHVIPYAWCDDDALLDEAQQAASATAGRLYFTATGKLRYLNMSTLAANTTADISLTGSEFVRAKKQENPDQFADVVVVGYSPRVPDTPMVLYEMDEHPVIKPGETRTFYARLGTPALSIATPVKETDYWLMTAGGKDMNSSCTVSVTKYAQKAEIEITNSHSFLAANIMYFRLRGQPLRGRQTKQVRQRTDPTQAESEDTRTRSVRNNLYLQTEGVANALVTWLADRYKYNPPLWRLTLPAIPQIEIGDRISFTDARDVPTAREGYVISNKLSFTSPSRNSVSKQALLKQELILLDAADLFQSTDYFEIGVTALGSGSAWY